MKAILQKIIILELLCWLNFLMMCWLMIFKVVPINNLLVWAFQLVLMLIISGCVRQIDLIIKKYNHLFYAMSRLDALQKNHFTRSEHVC